MIYLDHNASAPPDPDVLAAVYEAMRTWANPGSIQHRSGQEASYTLETARKNLASALATSPAEVVFTSGATEAATLAIVGLVLGSPIEKRDIVVSRAEHKAILNASELAAKLGGGRVFYVDVGLDGAPDADSLSTALGASVAVAAFMLVNNETGVIANLEELQILCDKWDVKLVCDATQAVGKMLLPAALRKTTYFFSGHKIGTPKGIGALVISRESQEAFLSIIPGGGQERGVRGGTENPPLAAGLSVATEKAISGQELHSSSADRSKRRFLEGLKRSGVDYRIVAESAARISNTVNLMFPGVDGDAILANLNAVQASTGSACNTANPEPSHVLLAMGLSFSQASNCVRFSFGFSHTADEIDEAVKDVCQAVRRIMTLEGLN